VSSALLLLRVKDLLLKHVLLVLKELARRVLGRRAASVNTSVKTRSISKDAQHQ